MAVPEKKTVRKPVKGKVPIPKLPGTAAVARKDSSTAAAVSVKAPAAAANGNGSSQPPKSGGKDDGSDSETISEGKN